MAITRDELNNYLDKLFKVDSFQDYCPNGLQIEGKPVISKIAYAVSCTKESVEKAVAIGADALIVHHGLFWRFHGVRTITNEFAARIKPLIQNDISLIGHHLPLDAHLEIGNAASIAKKLEMKNLAPFGDHKGSPTGVKGELSKEVSVSELEEILEKLLNHKIILSSPNPNATIKSLGIITGGANSDWVLARDAGLDAYLTGEISEHDWHDAKEAGIHYFAGGHNATEQFGIQSLLKHLSEQFKEKNLEHFYLPSSNPA